MIKYCVKSRAVLLAICLVVVSMAGGIGQADDCPYKCVQDCEGIDSPCLCATLDCSQGNYTLYTAETVFVRETGGTSKATYVSTKNCYTVGSCTLGTGSFFANCAGTPNCENASLYLYCTSCPPVIGNSWVQRDHYECEECHVSG